jgi:broad specificity phosphatase PhoE
MNKLFLIKHAMPEIQPEIPANQWVLSKSGRLSCSQIADHLQKSNLKNIISSKEAKAQETAHLIASYLDLPCHTVDNLHEHDRSNESYDLSKEEFENNVNNLFGNPDLLVYGKETARQAQNRFDRAIHKIVTENMGQDVGIVSHGTVISLFVALYNQINPFEFWQQLGLPSIICLSISEYQLNPEDSILSF